MLPLGLAGGCSHKRGDRHIAIPLHEHPRLQLMRREDCMAAITPER